MKPSRRVLLPSGLCLWILCAGPGLRAADPIESLEKAAQEWVRVRAETVRLESDWGVQKELLASAASALAERAQAGEEKRDNLKAKTAADRTALAELQAKNQAAAEAMQATDARLKELQARLVRLRPSLPPRLSEALELPYRTLAEEKTGPSERMQVIMTILNRCVQFNRAVTSGEEVLTIDGEPGSKSLAVIYWGLSHGYALDRITGRAWMGAPGPAGWQWTAHPEAARAVAALIAIRNDKTEPEFIAVPARLAHPAAPNATITQP